MKFSQEPFHMKFTTRAEIIAVDRIISFMITYCTYVINSIQCNFYASFGNILG